MKLGYLFVMVCVLACTLIAIFSIGAGMAPGAVLAEVAVIAAAECAFGWWLLRLPAGDE